MQTRHGMRTLIGSTAVMTAFVIGVHASAQEPAEHGARHQQVEMPTSGVRAELLGDLDILEEKYTSLAEATTAHYAWRPAEGVRSVSEVFMHIAGANLYIPTIFGVDAPEGMEVASLEEAFGRMQEMEKVTEPAEVMERLSAGIAHARHAIVSVPDTELDTEIMLFGQPATKRTGLILLVSHMHEHLGQAVAYARMNGVVPPWSAGG